MISKKDIKKLKRLNNQRGEIATIIAFIGIGILVIGMAAGRQLLQKGTEFLTRAAKIQFPPVANNHLPNGAISFSAETSASCRISGWACDADNFDQTVKIEFYENNHFLDFAFADGQSAEISSCGGKTKHAFSFDFSQKKELSDDRIHNIEVKAANINNYGIRNGKDKPLNEKLVSIRCPKQKLTPTQQPKPTAKNSPHASPSPTNEVELSLTPSQTATPTSVLTEIPEITEIIGEPSPTTIISPTPQPTLSPTPEPTVSVTLIPTSPPSPTSAGSVTATPTLPALTSLSARCDITTNSQIFSWQAKDSAVNFWIQAWNNNPDPVWYLNGWLSQTTNTVSLAKPGETINFRIAWTDDPNYQNVSPFSAIHQASCPKATSTPVMQKPALLYFYPEKLTVSGNSQISLFLDAQEKNIGFVKAEITFNPARVKLIEVVNVSSYLSKLIDLTPVNLANQTGKLKAILALPPEGRNNPPSGIFKLLDLTISPNIPSTNQIEYLQINLSNSQIVDMLTNKLTVDGKAAQITINQPPTPTVTPLQSPALYINPDNPPTSSTLSLFWNQINAANNYYFQISAINSQNPLNGNYLCTLGISESGNTCFASENVVATPDPPGTNGLAQQNSVNIYNLDCAKTYYVHVKAVNTQSGNSSAWSESAPVTTQICPTFTPLPTTIPTAAPTSFPLIETTPPVASNTPNPTATIVPSPFPTQTPVATVTLIPSPTATETPVPTPTPVPVPGDANGDRNVDSLDYAIWLENYGKNVSGGASMGDFNNDGTVNDADLTILLDNFNL